MGRDGAVGLLQIRKGGGRTFGQDERSCVVYGMPRAAQEMGAVEFEVSLERLAPAVLNILSTDVKLKKHGT
jgi:two-component system chemotaxis response regulator CheB